MRRTGRYHEWGWATHRETKNITKIILKHILNRLGRRGLDWIWLRIWTSNELLWKQNMNVWFSHNAGIFFFLTSTENISFLRLTHRHVFSYPGSQSVKFRQHTVNTDVTHQAGRLALKPEDTGQESPPTSIGEAVLSQHLRANVTQVTSNTRQLPPSKSLPTNHSRSTRRMLH